jgi:membrane-bound ClpP family serine protease
VIFTVQESAQRSILLTGLSYPLVIVGAILLFMSITIPGAVLLGSGVFLIGVNELCLYIAKCAVVREGIGS